MDYRCPDCGSNIAKRRLSETVLVGLEIECPHCKNVVRHNIHRIEAGIVMLNFAAIVGLAAIAYWLQSRDLVIAAVGAAMFGALAVPLIERTYLRHWPRYASIASATKPQRGDAG